MQVNRPEFYNAIRPIFPAGRLGGPQVQRIDALLDGIEAHGQLLLDDAAYILATAHHETDRFRTMREYASGKAYEGRASLGNTVPGDGKRFAGRGYVQITGRRNYTWASSLVGVDLIRNPEKACDLAIAAKICISGMLGGKFTGRRLAEFITPAGSDFVGARRVVNGRDKAAAIAKLAYSYRAALLSGGFGPPSGVMTEAPTLPVSLSQGDFGQAPVTEAKRFRSAMACGSSVAIVWAAIAATGVLPVEMSSPEVTNAIGGLLSALASAVGLCHFFLLPTSKP